MFAGKEQIEAFPDIIQADSGGFKTCFAPDPYILLMDPNIMVLSYVANDMSMNESSRKLTPCLKAFSIKGMK